MTDSVNVRELILEILMEVTQKNGYSHLILRSVLEKYQYLDKKERAFLTRVSEGTLQYMIELDYIINQFSKVKVNKMKPVIRNILRMSVYQIKYMDSVPDSAACNEAVKLAKKKGFSALSGFVNGVLRAVGRNLEKVTYPQETDHPTEAFSIKYSMPEWIVDKWLDAYGVEQTRELLNAFLTEAPITIRTNLFKITPEELKKRLESEGVQADPLKGEQYTILPYAFIISGFDYLNSLASFREGLFYVQDISSMMAAEYGAVKEGDYVIDVCAAPGGKSIHVAEKLHGTGMVEARDLTDYKIGLIEENIRRHGGLMLINMKAVQQDATVFDEASVEKADLLIADLPCSGLGVLRKKPDIKYRINKDGQRELVLLQQKILDTVCSYVKPGGTMVYSTCTINREENEDNVRWFLKKHPEFRLEKEQLIFPGKEYGDGFFLAKLVRMNSKNEPQMET